MITSQRFKKVFLLNVTVILTLCISSYVLAQGKINYKFVGEKDFSYAGCIRKEFKVVVQEGITKEEIEKVAKIIYAQKKRMISNLREVQITFYYPDLNVNKDTPNAVANWNIGSSGKWSIYCHSLRIKQLEIFDETDKSVLRRDEFRKGIFITYDLIVLSNTLDEEAKGILKNKLNSLKKEWENKVEWLGVDLFLGENYLPFIKGEWVSIRSSRPKKGMNIEIDEDGRHQTKEQTKILSSERMRRKVYYELIQYEDKAQEEADRLYPTDPMKARDWKENIMKSMDKNDELRKKYRRVSLKKYRLSEKQLCKIAVEGVKKGWPAP